MVSCKIVDVLYGAVPSRLFRNFLIRTHVERCGRCQARLVSRTEAEALFVKSGDVRTVEELWSRIEPRTGPDTAVPEKKRARLRCEWAAGAATLLLAAAASFWLLRGVQTESVRADSARPADRFEISYINVGGAPAQAYIYQPKGLDMIIVWAGKNP
ncbi:MAG: hypothetical protein ABSG73_11295 [Candidatus Aminicenantales bacterium]|jgi:hypothetical protein